MLDERLQLAARMFTPCTLGADIGTDHGLLPCYLLSQGICQRMILSDVSPKALRHAEAQVLSQQLHDKATLVCADGLKALPDKPCGCVSIMGMGGETIAGILTQGYHRLQGAALVLSAHTDLPLVRQAVQQIGYHFVREELCRAAGRFYVVWKALPGAVLQSEDDLRFGNLLRQPVTPLHRDYFSWRINVLSHRLSGLLSAREQDSTAIAALRHDIACYQARLEASPC